MRENKKLIDTTLRDGEQCPGIAFQPEDKIKLALLLDEIGVYEMEVGLANRETEGTFFVPEIMAKKKNAKVSLWSRMDLQEVSEAIAMQPDLIHIGVPVSYVQIYTKLKKNKTWVIKNTVECIEKANQYNIPVTIGFEDSTRADIGFMLSIAKTVNELGVTTIRLADTVGLVTPDRGEMLVKEMKKLQDMKYEIHEHNDLGMAVANSIAMLRAGADMVDCTLLGLGERAGNCNMLDLIHASEHIFDYGVNKKMIQQAEQELIQIINMGLQNI